MIKGRMMKPALIILILALAPVTLSGMTGVYTNVNGIVVGLVFYQTTIEAGQFVNATMVLSNASQTSFSIRGPLVGGDFLDTAIGDYIVSDESGRVLPKVVWQMI